jgi:hypothetical protein
LQHGGLALACASDTWCKAARQPFLPVAKRLHPLASQPISLRIKGSAARAARPAARRIRSKTTTSTKRCRTAQHLGSFH